MASVGFPSSQPLSPEWNQLAPRRGPVDSAERPMNTSTSPPSRRSANQHWHSHSLSTPLSVTPHLRFDGHLIELQICLKQGSSQLAPGEAAFLQRATAPPEASPPSLSVDASSYTYTSFHIPFQSILNTQVKTITCVT